jgi:hypothetical protein
MHEKWMKQIIDLMWQIALRWEILQQYKDSQPNGVFFALSSFDTREAFFRKLSHAVALCEEVAKHPDIGLEGQVRLEELRALYKKAESEDRSRLDYDDCGLKVYRDKVLAHPVNPSKDLGGKEQLKISMKWETVEQTLAKLREFCAAVERHKVADWKTTSYLGETGEAADDLKYVLRCMQEAKEYDRLKQQLCGQKATVWYDWKTEKFMIKKQDAPASNVR